MYWWIYYWQVYYWPVVVPSSPVFVFQTRNMKNGKISLRVTKMPRKKMCQNVLPIEMLCAYHFFLILGWRDFSSACIAPQVIHLARHCHANDIYNAEFFPIILDGIFVSTKVLSLIAHFFPATHRHLVRVGIVWGFLSLLRQRFIPWSECYSHPFFGDFFFK